MPSREYEVLNASSGSTDCIMHCIIKENRSFKTLTVVYAGRDSNRHISMSDIGHGASFVCIFLTSRQLAEHLSVMYEALIYNNISYCNTLSTDLLLEIPLFRLLFYFIDCNYCKYNSSELLINLFYLLGTWKIPSRIWHCSQNQKQRYAGCI